MEPKITTERRRRADFFEGDVAMQRGLRFVGGQHLTQVLEDESGEGAKGLPICTSREYRPRPVFGVE